jgi:hypothetical protein
MGTMVEEQHYRIKQLAKLLAVSSDTAREPFRNEPGVLKIRKRRSRFGPIKRPYETLLVPAHVYIRVKKRLSSESV